MDLETGSIVNFLEALLTSTELQRLRIAAYTPYTAQGLLVSGFEDLYIEAMADTVGSSRYTSKTGTDNGNLWSLKLSSQGRCIWRVELIEEPLKNLVQEQNWVVEAVP